MKSVRLGQTALVSEQWLEGRLLVEAFGPWRFGFLLSANGGGMRFHHVRSWLGPVSLPAGWPIRLRAWTRARGSGWRVCVRIDLPLLGLLLRYSGMVVPR